MRTYQHSGIVPFTGALMAIAAGSLAALFLAVVYAFSFQYIPFIYLNFLLAIALGGGIGLTVGLTAREGKLRNVSVVAAIAIIAALLGLYVQWGATVYAACPPDRLPELWSKAGLLPLLPQNIYLLMQDLFAEGSWSLTSGSPVRGWPLFALWVFEAITILASAFHFATSQIANQPFCEKCQEWIAGKSPHLYTGAGHERVWSDVQHGAFESLALTPRATGQEPTYMRLTLNVCEGCHENNYLTITACRNTIDPKGNHKLEVTNLVTNLILQPAQAEIVVAANLIAPDSDGTLPDVAAQMVAAELRPGVPAEANSSSEPQLTS
jgi:hypothetical protein